MMHYRLRFTPEAAQGIARLHPEVKRLVKDAVDELRQNPYLGDDLQDELAGFKSFKPKRYRILYTVDDEKKCVEIFYVGHRRDVYENFRRILNALKER